MWKGALVLVLLFVAGHFAMRYVRTNPLDPVIEGREIVVETREYAVRLGREGPVEGTYLVASARSLDWSNEPANVELSAIDLSQARDYMRANPDFHRYGATPGLQLENAAARLALIGANRLAYGELRNLIDVYEERIREHGERLCLTLKGDALHVSAAQSLEDGTDHTAAFESRDGTKRRVFANQVSVADCVTLAKGPR